MTHRERFTYVILSAALVWGCCAGTLSLVTATDARLAHTACLRTAALDRLPPACD
jgi:hypothetical protein